MKQVTRWEAKDGQLFNTDREAEFHEVCIAFEDAFNAAEMKDVDHIFAKIHASEMRVWLKLNREAVLRLLLSYDVKIKAGGNRYSVANVESIAGLLLITGGVQV